MNHATVFLIIEVAVNLEVCQRLLKFIRNSDVCTFCQVRSIVKATTDLEQQSSNSYSVSDFYILKFIG